MVDFKSSIETGVAAAKFAAEKKQEIYSVISSVNEQLKEAFEGKVNFGAYKRENKKYKDDHKVKGFLLGMPTFNYEIEQYEALCVKNSLTGNLIELAKWSTSEMGYPCVIKYDQKETYCTDKDDLALGFSELLSDVKTGKAILEIINYEPKQI